ncbi:MAG: sulfatase-like hydrolase/transferase [Candidatus Hodarchaeota archaeon]
MTGNAGRPNIIVIMTDQHDPAVSGCYGDHVVQTPNIDRLSREGITFDAAYTTSPLCVPARLSFTSGQYISRPRVSTWNNSCWLEDEQQPTIARILKKAGYDALLCGKMHYEYTRRYGFDDMLSIENGHVKTGVVTRRFVDDTSVNTKAWAETQLDMHVGETSNKIHRDTTKTAAATRFIKNRKASDKPFLLMVGYVCPHSPLIAPQSYLDQVKGKVPMPELPDGLLENLPTNYKHNRMGFGYVEQDPGMVKKGRELYWALVGWVDNEIGKVLKALDESEILDNTIVIYTCDHGENKGDHGMWWKNNMYEHAARIPLIVRWPRKWEGNQRRSGACSTVDLVRTIAEIAGADVPNYWDGDSLFPYLDDPGYDWKDFALSEYYSHNIVSGFTMVRKGKWKYVYHAKAPGNDPETELYNLEEDPKEFNNLASSPEHAELVNELHASIVDELGEQPDDIEHRCVATVPYYKRPGFWTKERLVKKARAKKKIKAAEQQWKKFKEMRL